MRLSKFWLFLSLKCELRDQNFETDAQVIQQTQKILERIPKEEFKTTIKKMCRKNRSIFSCKWTVFREKKYQMYSLGK